jgi:hypothetical protein
LNTRSGKEAGDKDAAEEMEQAGRLHGTVCNGPERRRFRTEWRGFECNGDLDEVAGATDAAARTFVDDLASGTPGRSNGETAIENP